MRLCKYGLLIAAFPLLLKPNIGKSEDLPDTKPLEEEFLLFLAEVAFSEGESIDPLNMLEIDNDELDLGEVIQVNLNEKTATQKDSDIMNTEIETKDPLKEDQL